MKSVNRGRTPAGDGEGTLASRVEAWGSLETPLGRLLVGTSSRGVVRVDFKDARQDPRFSNKGPVRLGAGSPHEIARSGAVSRSAGRDAQAHLKAALQQLGAYFHGRRRRFEIPLDLAGTEFEKSVWRQLSRIPHGETRSYGQIAQAIGKPRGARAAGGAIGRNPLSIIVPCHRVIGANGSLTGFGGGIPRKRWLLDHESGARRLPAAR